MSPANRRRALLALACLFLTGCAATPFAGLSDDLSAGSALAPRFGEHGRFAAAPATASPSAAQPYAVVAPPHWTAAARLAPPAAMLLPTGSLRVVRAVLDDMHVRAFNPTAPSSKSSTLPGGVFINWMSSWDGNLATASTQTNIQTNGLSDEEDGVVDPRHDVMTDLTYLHNLLVHRAATGSPAYDGDIARMAPIVRAEFSHYTFYRAWLYAQLRDMAAADPSGGWDAISNSYARAMYAGWFEPSVGTIADLGHGHYRVDWAVEAGAAMIDAGQRLQQPALVAAGRATVAHVLAHARDPRTGLFPLEMAISPTGAESVLVADVKLGAEAQLLDALLLAYQRTGDPAMLSAVTAATSELFSSGLGLWDSQRLGFFFAVHADGTGLQANYKESRQGWMLVLLHHLDTVTGGAWRTQEAGMLTVIRQGLYHPEVRGFVYRLQPGFGLYVNHARPGFGPVVENWVTSEADGISLNALLTAL